MGDLPATLDPNDYVVLPDVAVIDEFHLVRPGHDVYIDAAYLQSICDTAARREQETGDYCPVVIGHRDLRPGAQEVDQPRVVGYARNWKVAPLFNTGRQACKPDLWIKKPYYHTVRDYPRRSAELWVGRTEVDPISLLGSTVPHRDLGLLPVALARAPHKEAPVTIDHDLGPLPVALNRDPAEPPVSVTPTQESCPMPDEKKPDAKPDPEDKGTKTPGNAEIVELLNKIVSMLSGPKAPEGAAGQPGPEGGEGDDMDDEEWLNQLLAQEGAAGAGGEPSKKEEQPVQNGFSYPGPTNVTMPKAEHLHRLEKLEADNLKLVTQLARREIEDRFKEFKAKGIKIEDEAAWVEDLLTMPDDRRVAQLNRLSKLPAAPVGLGRLDSVQHAVTQEGVPGKDRGCTAEEANEVAQLARTESLSYAAAHKKRWGYYPFGHQDNRA